MHTRDAFLPTSRDDMHARGWYYYDFLLVTGDAYVDHPSFGTAVISRVLEQAGMRVAVLAQPDFHSCADFLAMGAPRYGVLINSGNIDSMVAHYSVARRRRIVDAYTPGGKMGKRPDRAVLVYCNRAREAFGELPIVIGGLEASLRRFAHYDYWDDRVRNPILVDSGADLLSFGMGERSMVEIAQRLARGEPVGKITDVRGTCFLARDAAQCSDPEPIFVPSVTQVQTDKRAYARAALLEQEEQDPVWGHALIQPCADGRLMVQNPPSVPLETPELDDTFALPYTRAYHPDYEVFGGVKAIEEVQHSIIHNRGCFGSCTFCALTMHQGRYVSARSHDSVVREAEQITQNPAFKGYIHDVGGPTANFDHPACKRQKEHGSCRHRQCLYPEPCPNLDADQSSYTTLLRKLRALPRVKKVFVKSGIRYDYLLADRRGPLFSELVAHHVSGQLKVAPEHISPKVLSRMGKPSRQVYDTFCEQFYKLCHKHGKEQYLVPYLMSSHPGSGLDEAIELALYLKAHKLSPQQVQDFYPTPGTLATAMYYTGLDPRTMQPVFVAKTPQQKAMQRALLQFRNPKNHHLVRAALREAGRGDLIGHGRECLVPPAPGSTGRAPTQVRSEDKRGANRTSGRTGQGQGRKGASAQDKRAGQGGAATDSRNQPDRRGARAVGGRGGQGQGRVTGQDQKRTGQGQGRAERSSAPGRKGGTAAPTRGKKTAAPGRGKGKKKR